MRLIRQDSFRTLFLLTKNNLMKKLFLLGLLLISTLSFSQKYEFHSQSVSCIYESDLNELKSKPRDVGYVSIEANSVIMYNILGEPKTKYLIDEVKTDTKGNKTYFLGHPPESDYGFYFFLTVNMSSKKLTLDYGRYKVFLYI